jgi:hypothetical protein
VDAETEGQVLVGGPVQAQGVRVGEPGGVVVDGGQARGSTPAAQAR